MMKVGYVRVSGSEGAFFRGKIERGNELRCTLRQFDNGEDAELYALAVVLRWRGMFGGER